MLPLFCKTVKFQIAMPPLSRKMKGCKEQGPSTPQRRKAQCPLYPEKRKVPNRKAHLPCKHVANWVPKRSVPSIMQKRKVQKRKAPLPRKNVMFQSARSRKNVTFQSARPLYHTKSAKIPKQTTTQPRLQKVNTVGKPFCSVTISKVSNEIDNFKLKYVLSRSQGMTADLSGCGPSGSSRCLLRIRCHFTSRYQMAQEGHLRAEGLALLGLDLQAALPRLLKKPVPEVLVPEIPVHAIPVPGAWCVPWHPDWMQWGKQSGSAARPPWRCVARVSGR